MKGGWEGKRGNGERDIYKGMEGEERNGGEVRQSGYIRTTVVLEIAWDG